MKFRLSPLWFSLVAFLTVLQVGVTLALVYFLAVNLITINWQLVLGIIAIQGILAVDLLILYGLIQAAQRWEPSEE